MGLRRSGMVRRSVATTRCTRDRSDCFRWIPIYSFETLDIATSLYAGVLAPRNPEEALQEELDDSV
jgi:hypothetical protein